MRKYNCKRLIVMMIVVLAMVCLTATTAFAAGTGDVAGAVDHRIRSDQDCGQQRGVSRH